MEILAAVVYYFQFFVRKSPALDGNVHKEWVVETIRRIDICLLKSKGGVGCVQGVAKGFKPATFNVFAWKRGIGKDGFLNSCLPLGPSNSNTEQVRWLCMLDVPVFQKV